ncbi:4-hydroxy-3-methylbut-2-enyl diphosphate reductase [Candidatus Woesearchaeota archaeon]|nr:4-hydroxy-3-methylbut-2-enyl diphosphate reductase [Candidatus Woesearchaeota archaeon]
MEAILASPRGFCAGVERAIKIVELALQKYGAPVYVRHEIVHNKHVVESLKEKGAVFVDELSDVPPNNHVIFSAHGVSPAVHEEAKLRNLHVIDATCPLVFKVHYEVKKFAQEGHKIVVIGHHGHPEIIGTMGEAPDACTLVETPADVDKLPPYDKVAVVTQTTLSTDETADVMTALKQKYPHLVMPPKEDICYATTNRQHAVKAVAAHSQVVLVVGSHTSSNSKRLVEAAERAGARAYLIDDASHINTLWLTSARTIGVSAGASAPEELVQGVIERLKQLGVKTVREERTVDEDMAFALPKI